MLLRQISNCIFFFISYRKHFAVQKTILLCIDEQKQTLFSADEDISRIINSKIEVLSGGELRYLCVKLLLFGNTKFCLLDEPYSGLSPIYAEKINKLLVENPFDKGIYRRQATVWFVQKTKFRVAKK